MVSSPILSQESAFARRKRLFERVVRGDLSREIVCDLLPSGEGLLYEKDLWDYKAELPTLPADRRPSDEEKELYSAKMAEVVKDVVSFYNSYGGYILAGIHDKTREVVGYAGRFDCADLAKKVYGATRHEIDCHYVLHDIQTQKGLKKVGLLFVPRRPYSRNPTQFLRDAPQGGSGKQAYKANQIYFRFGDECKAAQNSEDYSFLCGTGRRELSFIDEFRSSAVLTNNLGPRDPGFIKFIGRETYLRELWRWICDPFIPIKLLAGIGGVGKTTLVREFAEDLIRNAPIGLEKLIWLSAKKQFYTAILGKYQPTSRVDFSDLNSLLKAILGELGFAEKNIEADWSIQELLEECVSALRLFPALLVIDDVDSLEPMQQQEVFQTVIQLVNQTAGHAGTVPSRALLTTRLDLGAAPAQLVRVAGLDLADFTDYIAMTAEALGMPLRTGSPAIKHFRDVTDGSPIFAASILRLVQNGANLDVALKKWKGSDGEEVRKFAFKRELDKLSESQIRTLYAACLLGDTSFVELQTILQSNDRLLNNDIGQLRSYHLVAFGEDLPGGARVVIPSSLQLVTEVIREKIRDPKRIERECARTRSGTPRVHSEITDVVRRISALWREKRFGEALELAIVTEKKNPNDPDVKSLLGHAHLLTTPPDASKADIAFHQGHELKCQRPELPILWLKAKALREDWMGLLEVTELFPESAEMILARAQAYTEIGKVAVSSGNLRRAAEQWLIATREIDQAVKNLRARGRESELKTLRKWLVEQYVHAIDGLTQKADERIDVWSASLEAFSSDLRPSGIIKLGVDALAQWWTAVEQRQSIDTRAKSLMQTQLKKLDGIIEEIVIQEHPDRSLVSSLSHVRSQLQARVNRYAHHH